MIFVDRKSVVAPSLLTSTSGIGHKETAAAIAHFTGTKKKETYKKFSAYRDPVVKEALTDLFRGKCAYCESKFLHVYPGDIEHFRPKGEIADCKPSKPGYYWLAANWDNLLLSCRNCNQKLNHLLYGESKKIPLGKMNQFPLSNESNRVRIHSSDILLEENDRLLINPCVDEPEEHFEYDEKTAVIRAKNVNGELSKKGQTSIKIYVLQRVALVEARERVLIAILAQIQRVKEATLNLNSVVDSDDAARQYYFEKVLRAELGYLKAFLKDDQEYLGLARQVIRKFLSQFTISI